MPDPPELAALREDLRRYPPRPWVREPSVYALAVHRFGTWADRRGGPAGRLAGRLYWALYRVVELATGISLPKSAAVGPGCRIHHFGNIVVHEDVRIGANCTLRQGVTLGNRHEAGPVPVLADEVELGAYAQVLGGVHVGAGAKVGAMAVVLADVPAGATAVGNPARIVAGSAPRPAEASGGAPG